MSKGTTVGLALLAIGIILWIAYGLYLGFEEIMQSLDFVTGFVAGLIIVGIIVLLVSIVIEQRRDTKKMKEQIKKEDLEP
jgi:low affinity Fe/Cu permease